LSGQSWRGQEKKTGGNHGDKVLADKGDMQGDNVVIWRGEVFLEILCGQEVNIQDYTSKPAWIDRFPNIYLDACPQ
jgi:hypothetical protein